MTFISNLANANPVFTWVEGERQNIRQRKSCVRRQRDIKYQSNSGNDSVLGGIWQEARLNTKEMGRQ